MSAWFWLLALTGFLGSIVLLGVAGVRLARFSRNPFAGAAAGIERRLVYAALLAAVLGAASLFVMPAYQGSSCTSTAPVTVVTVSPSEPDPPPQITSVPITECTEATATVVEVNGPQVIALFTIPILFALVPLAFLRRRFRAVVYALAAFLLAAQVAMGMSGYGLVFAPSSLLLVLAGFTAVSARRIEPAAAA